MMPPPCKDSMEPRIWLPHGQRDSMWQSHGTTRRLSYSYHTLFTRLWLPLHVASMWYGAGYGFSVVVSIPNT
jgi:hypothetical protein